MNADIIRAMADLAWPVLAAVLLLALLPTLTRVLKSRGVSIKYGQMELSVQDASEQLRKQIEDLQDQVRKLNAGGAGAPSFSIMAADATTVTGSSTKTILWVDEQPENNAYEIAKLQDDGHNVLIVRSTGQTIRQLECGAPLPDRIISDMGRNEGAGFQQTAGINLIRTVRAKEFEIPILIYTSNDAVRRYASQVSTLSGCVITASPIELMQFVEQDG